MEKSLAMLHDAILLANPRPDHKVKVLITGYSLGASVGQLAAYDIMCNDWLSKQKFGPNVELLGLITLGTPSVTFYGPKGRSAFIDVVPETKRLQLQACSGKACDMVTMNIPSMNYMPIQPERNVQVVMSGGCRGLSGGLRCHLLSTYDFAFKSRTPGSSQTGD